MIAPEPVIALLALIMLPPTEVPLTEVETVRDEDAVVEPSVAPSMEVRAESEIAVKPEQSAAMPAIPPAEWSRVQSSIDFVAISSA